MEDFADFLSRRNLWSLGTFGRGPRQLTLVRHIESELNEIRETPYDLMEWVDVILLALDGAHRTGHSADEIIEAIYAKQEINRNRKWE